MFNSPCFLLQDRYGAKLFVILRMDGKTFGGNNSGMIPANLEQRSSIVFSSKMAPRVGAHQSEGMHPCQFVPNPLQSESGVALSFLPEHRTHFSKGPQRLSWAR